MVAGPQNCREYLNMFYRLNECKEILRIIEQNNPEEIEKLPKNLLQFDRHELVKSLKSKIESNDNIIIMY